MSTFWPGVSVLSSNTSVATLTVLPSVQEEFGVRAIFTLNGVFIAMTISLAWLYAMR